MFTGLSWLGLITCATFAFSAQAPPRPIPPNPPVYKTVINQSVSECDVSSHDRLERGADCSQYGTGADCDAADDPEILHYPIPVEGEGRCSHAVHIRRLLDLGFLLRRHSIKTLPAYLRSFEVVQRREFPVAVFAEHLFPPGDRQPDGALSVPILNFRFPCFQSSITP